MDINYIQRQLAICKNKYPLLYEHINKKTYKLKFHNINKHNYTLIDKQVIYARKQLELAATLNLQLMT